MATTKVYIIIILCGCYDNKTILRTLYFYIPSRIPKDFFADLLSSWHVIIQCLIISFDMCIFSKIVGAEFFVLKIGYPLLLKETVGKHLKRIPDMLIV